MKMDKSESQKIVHNKVIDQNPADITVSVSDTRLTVIIKAGGHEAAYTAEEARELARALLSAHYQRGWGNNIVPTADYICDLANVVDDKIQVEDVEQKWDHDGEFGGSREVTVVADASDIAVMSFNSKIEAMRFCADWNSRPSWITEYYLVGDGEKEAIWNLTESEGELVAKHLEEEITQSIRSENVPDWEISVEYQPEVPTEEGAERIFSAGVRNQDQRKERYRYQIYYSATGEGINTLTQQPVTNKRRVRIDRQRGRILEAMSKVPKRFGLYFGPPDADLEWLNLGPVLSPDHDFP